MDDQLLFIIVAAGLTAWCFVWLIEKVFNWYRKRRDVKTLFAGDIPVKYEETVKTAQQLVNDGKLSDDVEMFTKLQDVRESVAHIRYQGYLAGERDGALGRPFETGVRINPHKPHTGASRQWVRGYCMGRNVIDIKPYMDQA